ncbi:MAG: heme o synthase [Gammaproteobacteria bacterium]|nr:heme o synthase [Gammaproteobacteria bacterium]
MDTPPTGIAPSLGSTIGQYLGLCKLKVVALIVFTALVGMFLAVPAFVPLDVLVFGSLGIGLAAASGAAFNHVVDRRIDGLMARTSDRPLPTGGLDTVRASLFAGALTVVAMVLLVAFVNWLTAVLTFLSMVAYAVVYTVYLKHATPQNIVIGGAAGAMPPVLGWTAVTNSVDPHALLLFLIIFVWTPPHFWALAIHRRDDYAEANVPMLPVTHGIEFTRVQILLYTVLLCLATLLPYVTGMTGLIYLAGAVVLDAGFLYYAIALYADKADDLPIKTFGYSIWYLMALFAFLLLDHYFPTARLVEMLN